MALYKLAFGGNLYGDIWECGLHLNKAAGGAPAQAALDDMQQDIQTFLQDAGCINAATLNYVKLNEISATTRRYVDQGQTYENAGTPLFRSTNGDQILPQLTLCVSLLTGQKRGAAARGRFYPPPTGFLGSVGSDGKVSGAKVAQYADAAKAFIDNLNNSPGNDGPVSYTVCVLGKGGVIRNVTDISVGNVADTQRRRRSALVETYTSRTVQ